MGRNVLKTVFRIEYIFIYTALVIFFCTIYFKRASNAQVQVLDTKILLLQMRRADMSAEEAKEAAQTLLDDYRAFTYFDPKIQDELNEIVQGILGGEEVQSENSGLVISFQNDIHTAQDRLNLGYDSLLYSSLFLIAIAAFIILEKFFRNSMQLHELKTMQSEQANFSRDLHDGVAQNLAALKVYLEKEDLPKSKFYARQALNEIRYMIGSGNIDFSDDFEKTAREMCVAFETNIGIKTSFYTASERAKSLSKNTRTPLARILQEALSNIARHSDATEVEVKIVDGLDEVRFIISDNGKGFEQSAVDSKNRNDAVKHYGIANIKKRAQLIGGTAEFINNGGTTIAISIKNPVH